MKFGSHVENCFTVTDSRGWVTRYPCDKRGFYVKEKKISRVHATTIEGFTQREVDRAVRARKLYHDLCAENISNVKIWIRSNQAKNAPASIEDLNLTDKIFKADVATCKGKSTHPKPPVVSKNDIVKIPPELGIQGMKLELAIDVIYINDESFLHSVDRTIRNNGPVALGTRRKGENYTKEMLFEGLDNILRFYNRADVYISMIHCNHEFKSIFKELENSWDIEFNFCSSQEHVPDIEHENRVLQGRFRVMLYRLPFRIILRTIIRYGVLWVTKTRSNFPKKTGMSKYFSSHTILKQRQINFNKEFVQSFGDYVQAVED